MRKISVVVVLLIIIAGSSFPAQAADAVTVIVDGQKINFPDAKAYIDENGRTQIPARFIGEALGADTTWDPFSQNVIFKRVSASFGGFNETILFRIGSANYYISGGESNKKNEKHEMDTKARIEKGRTYVPARYVAEALAAKVIWADATRTLTITSPVKNIGGFDIPKSYTQRVAEIFAQVSKNDENELPIEGIKATEFYIRLDSLEQASICIEQLKHLLPQQLGAKAIQELDIFLQAHKTPGDNIFQEERIYDSDSKRYADVLRSSHDYLQIWLYPPNYKPQ